MEKLLRWIYPLPNHQLYIPLKDWKNEKDWKSDWDWYSDSSVSYLYHHISNNNWHKHLKIDHSHHSYHLEYLTYHLAPDDLKYRASVNITRDHIRVLNSSSKLNASI